MTTPPPDYDRIHDLARSLLAELGQQPEGDSDAEWFEKASRALEDTVSAASGALATLDRLRGTEVQTSRAWRSRCAEALDLGRVVPDAILGVKNVQGRTCSRCKRVLPLNVFTATGKATWCSRCQSDHYSKRAEVIKVWSELS